MKKTNKIERLLYIMLVLIALLSLINTFIIQGRIKDVKNAREVAKEFLRPAKIEVTKILPSDCKECFDIEGALENIKKQNVNITKEEILYFNENKAKELINVYNIAKIPILVISGEVNKTDQLKNFFDGIGDFLNDTNFIYTNLKPPYYDVSLAKIVGMVSIVNIIDSTCKDCRSLSHITSGLKVGGIVISEEKFVEYNSEEGMVLIEEFEIIQVPALLISKEIEYYEAFQQELPRLNLTERKGFYAVHSLIPPYRDLKDNKIVGLVDLILIKDNSCNTCYDVNINKQVLSRFGIIINSEKSYDINSKEGIELKNRYNITKVPTIILSPETNVYTTFVRAWQNVGSVEEDGWFIMRKPDILGEIKDLEDTK